MNSNLTKAHQIYEAYKLPDGPDSPDIGNLYWALGVALEATKRPEMPEVEKLLKNVRLSLSSVQAVLSNLAEECGKGADEANEVLQAYRAAKE